MDCERNKNNNICTLGDTSLLGEPLYRTYWVGMKPSVCNSKSNSLVADSSLKVQEASKMVIEERVTTTYEACHWIISVDENKYRNDTGAYIELYIMNM